MLDVPLDLAPAVAEHASTNSSRSGIVAVARDGAVLRSLAWGPDPYDESTSFRVTSCTKSFTALALLALRRAGRLGLDDEVQNHLPEAVIDAPRGWPSLRVRHLMSMSGGLATDNPWGDRQEATSREQLSAWMRSGLRLMFPPGSAYEYSNLGYALLGEIITRASGRPYRDYVMEEIVRPLGLVGTAFSADELVAVAPGYHRASMLPGAPGGWSPLTPTPPGAFSPIGGLYSSVRDLARWADLHVRPDPPAGAAFTAADLLESQQPIRRIATAPAEEPLSGLVTTGYGHGLRVETYERHGTLVSHAGGYPGFTAYMCWHQPSGYAVLASANGSHSGAPSLARKVMLRLMLDLERPVEVAEPWPETAAALEALNTLVAEAGEADPAELARRHAHLFADNFELDFPLVDRVERLKEALVALGPVRGGAPDAPPEFERPCRARWRVPAEFGRLELLIELAPVAPFKVQTFSAEAVDGPSRVTLF